MLEPWQKGMAIVMNNNKKAEKIALCSLLGVAFGNALGLIIGIVFSLENLGIGLLIGTTIGSTAGLLIGLSCVWKVIKPVQKHYELR